MDTTDIPQRQPSYRDRELHRLMRQLRAAVKPIPTANASLAKVEARLRYVLRTMDLSDKTHAERAERLLTFGLVEQANTEASLIWDDATRLNLLARCPIGLDQHNRTAEALELGREVLA